MPIYRVEVTQEWVFNDIEAMDEFEAEELATEYAYMEPPTYTDAYVEKISDEEEA